MKRALLTLLILIAFVANASTYVSGGIYSNTIWTKANSPYIVTSNIVVFPSDTLTIQPGVTVKFYKNQSLSIRGWLIAVGTPIDSITFTSDSSSPYPGIWSGVGPYSIYKYCSFYYANEIGSDSSVYHCSFLHCKTGLGSGASLAIKGCVFINNTTGYIPSNGNFVDSCLFKHNHLGIDYSSGAEFLIQNNSFFKNDTAIYSANNGEIKNCNISQNDYGLVWVDQINIYGCIFDSNKHYATNFYADQDTIGYSTFRYNGIGIFNTTTSDNASQIYDNTFEENDTGMTVGASLPNELICNNICYNKYYGVVCYTSQNVDMKNNYWCFNDSIDIRKTIYDGYDDISLGLVIVTPFDTFACDSSGLLTSTVKAAPNWKNISVYPNPASSELSISMYQNVNGTIMLTNVLGQTMYTSTITGNSGTVQKIDISSLQQGVYFLQLESNGQVLTKKVLKI